MNRDELIETIMGFNILEYSKDELDDMSIDELKEILEDMRLIMGGDF